MANRSSDDNMRRRLQCWLMPPVPLDGEVHFDSLALLGSPLPVTRKFWSDWIHADRASSTSLGLLGLGSLCGVLTGSISSLKALNVVLVHYTLSFRLCLFDVLVWSCLFAAIAWLLLHRNQLATLETGDSNLAASKTDVREPKYDSDSKVLDTSPCSIIDDKAVANFVSPTGAAGAELAGTERILTTAVEEKALEDVRLGCHSQSDAEIVALSITGKLQPRLLEQKLADTTRAVNIRRLLVARSLPRNKASAFANDGSGLPYRGYDWDQVYGKCCENVIGYLPLPVGLAGPLKIDDEELYLPLATTEGALIASTSRGCKAINMSGGASTAIYGDGMTRGPCVGFPRPAEAKRAKDWLDSIGFQSVKAAFDSTSRFARLQKIHGAIAGSHLYLRFVATTGDAMGMNMVSKATEKGLSVMAARFPEMTIVSLSGNYCADKKPAALNWIQGRGKSVTAEAVIPRAVVQSTLKTDVEALVDLNMSKNLIGSAIAGSIGGFNSQASNIVSAMFLATGQDVAQNIASSNCITIMRKYSNSPKNQHLRTMVDSCNRLNDDLHISVTMPSMEVGTLGGGTALDAQGSMLDLLGVRGSHLAQPGANSQRLARIISAGVLAAELSLCSALASGNLVSAHVQLNRR